MTRLQWLPRYADMPTSWFRISMAARGLADELHRRMDADFMIELPAGVPHAGVATLLSVPPRERRYVKDSLDDLVKAGFVSVVERGGVTVVDCSNLPDVVLSKPRQRGSNQHVTRAQLTAGLPLADAQLTASVRSNEANSTEPFISASVENNREEKKREEHTDAQARVGGLSSLSSGLSTNLNLVVSELTRGYQARYEKHAGDAWMSAAANRREIQTVAAYVAAVPGETSEVVADVLDGFFASEWATKERWPWRALAKNPGSYRPDRTAEREAAARRKRWDEHAAREVARQAELAKQPQEPRKEMSQQEIEEMANKLLARLSQSTAMPTTKPKRKESEAAE